MTSVLISPAELAALPAEEIVIIDTRAPEAFAAGHIAGAVNLHDIFTYLATSTAEGMSELTQKFADAFGSAGLDGTKTAVI
jgi:thiosulfate/3-mercaptopyruvate sulfurtransferase